MKNFYKVYVLMLFSMMAFSCSSDDDSTVIEEELTFDKLLGKWEHIDTKIVKVTPMGIVNVVGDNVNGGTDYLNDPCYRLSMEFETRDLTYSGTDYDFDKGEYDCNLEISYTTKWWYDEGDKYFTELNEIDGDTYQDYWSFGFDLEGNLVIWEGKDNYWSENTGYIYRKAN